MYYKLPKEVLEGLVQYLSQRPWNEVELTMHTLSSLEKAEEKADEVHSS